MISGQDDIRKAYQDERVAGEYVARRFQTPLGALLHARQIRVVRDLIREQGIERAVEIAPGPARLTVDVAPLLAYVTLVDASAQMLAEARRRLAARGLAGRAGLVQADAFKLPPRTRAISSTRSGSSATSSATIAACRQIATILRPGGWPSSMR
jgi:ubiquinone/menaquinone biosynthesis C-methylase UbiE